MVARAGVTTALDMSGPIEKLLDEFSCANVGINVAALNAILPGRNISGNNPDREQLRNFINLSRRSGALGVKLWADIFRSRLRPRTAWWKRLMIPTAIWLGMWVLQRKVPILRDCWKRRKSLRVIRCICRTSTRTVGARQASA